MAQGVVWAFSVVLVLVGIAGFVVPADRAMTSGAPAYNIFHIVFGGIGLAVAATGNHAAAVVFLIGFGLIDLYQALASRTGWQPRAQFRWTRTDDALHLVIGAALVVVGVVG